MVLREETMGTFRKLAREAVIFMLAGLFLAATGSFIYLCRQDLTRIRAARQDLKQECDTLRSLPPGFGPYTRRLSDDHVTSQAECDLVFGPDKTKPPQTAPKTLPADFFKIMDDTKAEGTRIKNMKIDYAGNALVSLVVGAYGFAAGFGIWIFYRLVRFAVKG
jgi:hypothetical protein